MKSEDVKTTLKAIDSLWDELTETVPEDHGTTIGLPKPFIAPSWGIFHSDQFYWDSYFTIEGLLVAGKIELAQGMVENLTSLVEKFEFVPMRNRTFDTGISQPPLLTSMIRRVYEVTENVQWLKKHMPLAELEYISYWMNDIPDDHIVDHRVFSGLSRYADHFVVHQTAEHESGWDMSSRFEGRCLDFLPVDLNSLLYKYEADLEWFYNVIGDPMKADHFVQAAKERQRLMQELMWDERDGYFVDYDYKKQQASDFVSLAGVVPLWSGQATPEQAASTSQKLNELAYPGGLAMCPKDQAVPPQRQWDYPNGWPPYQWFAIKGLLNYKYEEQARDFAERWINTVTKVYLATGKIWEKYDVINQTVGVDGRYPTQVGFGWTNATYLALVKQFGFDK